MELSLALQRQTVCAEFDSDRSARGPPVWVRFASKTDKQAFVTAVAQAQVLALQAENGANECAVAPV